MPFASPNDPKRLIIKAKKAKEAGNFTKASEYYQKIIKVLGQNHNSYWNVAVNNLGNLVHNSGHVTEAQKFYRLAAENGFALGMFNLGFTFEKQGKNAEAIQWYGKAANAGHKKANIKYSELKKNEIRTQSQSATKTQNATNEKSRKVPSMRLIKTPRDAELNARDWMIYLGFSDARATPVGRDKGVDVTSSRAIGQVKFKGVKTSMDDIKLLHSTSILLAKRALFFSLGGYTQPALEFADQVQIALFEFDYQGAIKSINSSAKKLGL